jgi:hypothetical protein
MKLTHRLNARRGHHDQAPHDADHDGGDDTSRATAERLRSNAVATEFDPFSADPAEVRVHITAAGELVIDLRPAAVVGGPAATTDMACPNCDGPLRVDSLDSVAHRAVMACGACGFTFSQRLTAGRH